MTHLVIRRCLRQDTSFINFHKKKYHKHLHKIQKIITDVSKMNSSKPNLKQDSDIKFRIRFPLLAMGMISLITGIWIGLQRIGWSLPVLDVNWVFIHGPLMICGFLGTVIGMERAVAQNKLFFFLGPLFTGLGAILMLVSDSTSLSALFIVLGSIVLIANFIVVLIKFPSMHTSVMAIGALLFFVGNVLWFFGLPIPNIVMWWMGFLVLTIAGERLELSRLLQLSKPVKIFFNLNVLIFLAGVIITTFNFSAGIKISGVGMLLLAYWLLQYDMARKSIKVQGQHRFIAVALIVGFVWLGIGGILSLFFGNVQAGLHYDAILHAVFIGFVFSMIMGHAPIIFPAILRVVMEFKNRFYIHLGLLHVALLLRLISDISEWPEGRTWGGLFNGLAILLFLINTVTSIKKPE